jgi:hypothetical protein
LPVLTVEGAAGVSAQAREMDDGSVMEVGDESGSMALIAASDEPTRTLIEAAGDSEGVLVLVVRWVGS